LIRDSNLLLLFRANVLLKCAKGVAPFSPRCARQRRLACSWYRVDRRYQAFKVLEAIASHNIGAMPKPFDADLFLQQIDRQRVRSNLAAE
jgi:hypothetical protein